MSSKFLIIFIFSISFTYTYTFAEKIVCEMHPFSRTFMQIEQSLKDQENLRAGRGGGNADIGISIGNYIEEGSASRSGGNSSRGGGNTENEDESIDVKIARLKEAFPLITNNYEIEMGNPYGNQVAKLIQEALSKKVNMWSFPNNNPGLIVEMVMLLKSKDYKEVSQEHADDTYTHLSKLMEIHELDQDLTNLIHILYLITGKSDPQQFVSKAIGTCGEFDLIETKEISLDNHNVQIDLRCCMAMQYFLSMMDNESFISAVIEAYFELIKNNG